MANKIGSIPEFTSDEGVIEEVKQATQVEEKVTPAAPPAAAQAKAEAEKPLEELHEGDLKQDDGKEAELQRAVKGLQDEREKLLREVTDLRGKKREIKQEELIKVQEQLQVKVDELGDVNPDDVKVIDRVLRAKGFVTKEEASKMFYESVKQDVVNKFTDEFPEYKPENDPNDIRWNALQRELADYRMPTNPHDISRLLKKAHKGIASPVERSKSVPAQRRQIEVAGVGSGGTQRSSSVKTLDPYRRMQLEQGGFTKEDIDSIEKRL